MKEIKNKTVVIVTAFIAVVLIIILMLTQCGKNETDKEKEQSGSKEPGKEVIIDEKEDENGLMVGTPEDADKEQENNQVEFIGPGNADGTDKVNDGGTENKVENDETKKDESDKDKTDGDKDTGNLGEEKDSTGQYGEFF